MADGFQAKDAANVTVQILTDEVTDATLGTGQKQLVGIVDGTINSVNKLKVDASGYLQAKVAPAAPTIVTGNQSLAVSTTVVVPTVPATATHAFVTVEGGDVRYWEDGSNPTGAAGLYLPAGASAELLIGSVKFIKATGQPDAVVNLSYRKYV